MVCVYCGSSTQVTNSRLQKRANTVWRRRACTKCRAVFSTQEIAQYTGTWLIRTGNRRLESFSRDKLFLSIYSSCQHRKTALSDAAGLTETVMSNLLGQDEKGIIKAASIKQVAQVALSRFDTVAATHYLAFHKE
jgi:transcriptional regulator NrdR family protein